MINLPASSMNDPALISDQVRKVLEAEDNSIAKNDIRSANKWEIAKVLFPMKPFSWDIIPEKISLSLKQVARSCATNPDVLPGMAIAILCSIIGGTIKVSPKHGWIEPLIFWIAWIAASGTGKTPALNHLCEMIYSFQKEEDSRYEKELFKYKETLKEYEKRQTSKAEQDISEEPKAPEKVKSFFITNLTLEGLHHDSSGHGGVLHIREEISGFISSQNQYKNSKGDDREGWLKLYDGKPARLVRRSGSKTIYDLILNLVGGIQPETWWTEFGGNRGIFKKDGTIFRFTLYYEIDSFVESTDDIWDTEHSIIWEGTLRNALTWADEHLKAIQQTAIGTSAQPHILSFSNEARSKFIEWQNVMKGYRSSLPDAIKGYVPKVITQAVRASGAIYCLDKFSQGLEPGHILEWPDVQKGITLALHYFSHAIFAIESLEKKHIIETHDYDEQAMHLAFTLKSIQSDLESGRLAIGYIWQAHNSLVGPEHHIKSEKSMGALLRHYNLKISQTRHRANGKVGAYCLVWDTKTDDFIKVHNIHPTRKSSLDEDLAAMDIQDGSSASSTGTQITVNNVNMDRSVSLTVRELPHNTCEHCEHSEHHLQDAGIEK